MDTSPDPHAARVRAAARRVVHAHPGPVGELLARELRAYADFGHRFGSDDLLERLTADLLADAASGGPHTGGPHTGGPDRGGPDSGGPATDAPGAPAAGPGGADPDAPGAGVAPTAGDRPRLRVVHSSR